MDHRFSENKWELLSGIWEKKREQPQESLTYQDEEVQKLMQDQFLIRQAMKSDKKKSYNVAKAWEKVKQRMSPGNQRHMNKRWQKYAAAAVLLIGLGMIGLFHREDEEKQSSSEQAVLICPGKQTAELLLANGERILLNSQTGTKEIEEIGVKIVNDSLTGKLSYQASVYSENKNAESYNTLKVPKGGEYSLELPDGSVVWLNSETSLRFPVKFAADKREIYLQGEAYFKVAKNQNAPFHVYVAGCDITVLGTCFNVSAYADDGSWKTTLVKGAVRVKNGKHSIIMKPSEQYCVDNRSGRTELKTVDSELYTSWIDGKFHFNGYTFEEIVKKLERWYDFNMFYQNNEIRQMRFSGTINKHRPVEEMLRFLEKTTNVRFTGSGKTIVASTKPREL